MRQKEEPKKTLIGVNPIITDEIYIDDYTRALNQFASVEEVLNVHTENIAKGERNTIARIVSSTSGSSESENHLAALLIYAARNKQWVGTQRSNTEYAWETNRELKRAGESFGIITPHNTGIYLLPTPKLILHAANILKSYKQR